MDARVLYLIDFNGILDSNIIINPDIWYGVFLEINDAGRISMLVNNIIARHSFANLYITGYSDRVAHVNLYQNTLDGAPYGIYAYSVRLHAACKQYPEPPSDRGST